MATKDMVTKVWIVEGCIVCDACETAAPDVFEVLDDTCIVRPEALNVEFNKPRTEGIIEAAEECPVDVIKFDTVAEEVSDEPAAPAPEPVREAPAAVPTPRPKSPVVEAKPAPAIAAAVAVAAAPAPTAGGPDPSIAALLQAATSRGGHAGVLRSEEAIPDAAAAWQHVPVSELPPDAKQARVLETARKAKHDPSRRAVTGSAALGIGWLAFGLGTGVSAGPAFLRFMMPNVLEEPDPRIRVGKLAKYREMVPGDVNEDYKNQGIWMVRDGDRLAALSIICTHLGCIPNWLPNDRKFKCPCHGSGYKPDGINFEGPTPRPLERFRLFVADSLITVDKSKKFQHELGQWDQVGSYIEL